MTTEGQEDREGIWQQDWGAQANERTRRYASPEASTPEVTLHSRSLPSHLAAGGRFETPLASTLRSQPPAVLRSIASSLDAGPMLTVQSATPSSALAPVQREEAEPEPEGDDISVEEPAYVMPPIAHRPAGGGGSGGGLFAGATDFVLRLLRRPQEPERESEVEMPAPRPAPTSQPVPSSGGATTVARAPESPSGAPETSAPDRTAEQEPDRASWQPATQASVAQVEMSSELQLPASEPIPAAALPLREPDVPPLVLRSPDADEPKTIGRTSEGGPLAQTPAAELPTATVEVLPSSGPEESLSETSEAIASSQPPASEVQAVDNAIEIANAEVRTISRNDSSSVESDPALPHHTAEAPLARSTPLSPGLDSEADEPGKDEPPARPQASSAGAGLPGLFLTLRRLIGGAAEEREEQPQLETSVPAGSTPNPSNLPVTSSAPGPAQQPVDSTADAAPVLRSEAFDTTEESSSAGAGSLETSSPPASDPEVDAVSEPAENSFGRQDPSALQTVAYSRFALLRAQAAGEDVRAGREEDSAAVETHASPAGPEANAREDRQAAQHGTMPPAGRADYPAAQNGPLALRTESQQSTVTPSERGATSTQPVRQITRTVSESPGSGVDSAPDRPVPPTRSGPSLLRSFSPQLAHETTSLDLALRTPAHNEPRTSITRALERESLGLPAFDAPLALESLSSPPRTPVRAGDTSPDDRSATDPSQSISFTSEVGALAGLPELSLLSTALPGRTMVSPPAITRSVTPLVYRQAQRTGEASAASAMSANDLAAQLGYAPESYTVDPAAPTALMRSASDPSDGMQTLSVAQPAIQRLAGEGTADAAGTGGSTTAPPAGAQAAGSALDDPSKAQNAALDKLAREIYERLRRRLLMERERAGYGTAFS